MVPKSAPRSALNGTQSLNISMKPTVNATMTESVETCSCVSPSCCWNRQRNRTPRTMVKAEGNDFLSTFVRKFPCMRSLFGSSASTKDGAPIVSALTKVRWIGSKGYEAGRKMNSTPRMIE